MDRAFLEQLEHEKLEAMAELAAGAGHEINNPLAVIAGRAQLLMRGESDPNRRRDLALIQAQAMRVHEMIADMMLFARPPQPQLAPCDMGEILDSVLASVSTLADERGVSLVRLPCEPAPVVADRTQCIVALRAVCMNSLEAVARGGRIEAAVRQIAASSSTQGMDGDGTPPVGEEPCPGPMVEITIADDGPGIPPDVRRHLFDPFYSGRQAGRGLGMGLAKCWRIVTNHGGTIGVQSSAGEGTRFSIRLPAAAT